MVKGRCVELNVKTGELKVYEREIKIPVQKFDRWEIGISIEEVKTLSVWRIPK